MKWQSCVIGLGVGMLVVGVTACNDKSAPPTEGSAGTGKDRPAERQPNAQSKPNVPMGQLLAAAKREHAPQAGMDMPPGHPPVGTTMPAGHPAVGTSLPAGHPPIGNSGGMSAMGMPDMPSEPQHPEHMLQLSPPATWTPRPARPMTVAVYALPRAAGDQADAELTISHYPEMKDVTLQQHADRWAGMFKPSGTQPAGQNVKQYKLNKASHPTTVVDISGQFVGGIGATGGGESDYRLLAAVVETDDGPWFFKLLGPKATVTQHSDEFLAFVRQAK